MTPRPSPAPTAILDVADSRPNPNSRMATIRVNLMPDEVVVARRTEKLRRQIVIALGALLAALVLWFGFSWLQTSSAENDLSAAQRNATKLQEQQTQYHDLTVAQSVTAAVNGQLSRLMVGDLSWKDMLATLRAQARADVAVNEVVGAITSGAAASNTMTPASGPAVLNTTGKAAVGQLTITGTAKDKNAVAAFVDRLATVKGLAAPYVVNVSADQTGHTIYTVQVLLTTDALGGRYAVSAGIPSTTAGGN
jgi:hypothetical protein